MRRTALLLGALVGVLVSGIVLDAAVERWARSTSSHVSQPTGSPAPSPPPPLPPAEIAAAFGHPAPRVTSRGTVQLRREPLAELRLPSGRVVGADPFLTDALPFDVALAPGDRPVEVLVARFDDGDERVAAAVLGDGGKATRWELARTVGNRASSLAPGQLFGYGTDSGTGSFLSAEAAGDARADATYADRMLAELERHEHATWDWANVVVDPTGHLNVVAFASGWGDGGYATFVGFDAAGAAVAMLTDFDVLDARAPSPSAGAPSPTAASAVP